MMFQDIIKKQLKLLMFKNLGDVMIGQLSGLFEKKKTSLN